jgi:plastocyanin
VALSTATLRALTPGGGTHVERPADPGEKHVPTDTIEATTHLRERSSRTLASLTSLAAAALLVVASAVPALAQDVVVEGADGNVWDPDLLEIEPGTEVVFDMTGGDLGHNGVLDGQELFEIIEVGDSTSHVFDEEGEFNLVCTLHPGMEMDIIVGAGADGAAPDDDAEDEAPEDEDADEAPEDEDADDEAAEDDGAEETGDAAEEDAELAAADGDGEEGGGDTVLMLAVITALVLMIASFGLIRREGT